MASLFQKYGFDVPSLYVKSAPRTWDIRSIFSFARTMAPCLLVLEDIDTIVTYGSRSYFFNEVIILSLPNMPYSLSFLSPEASFGSMASF